MLNRHRIAWIYWGVMLLAISGCHAVEIYTATPATENATVTMVSYLTATPTKPGLGLIATQSEDEAFCISEVADWVEQEHTVTCFSYWSVAVREAIANDPASRMNAAYLDLETGDTTELSADICYQLSCGSMCFPLWRGMEGAIIESTWSTVQPSLGECEELLLSEQTQIFHESFSSAYGYYYCVLTKEGRIGWIRYEDDFRLGLSGGQSQITYFMWDVGISKKGK